MSSDFDELMNEIEEEARRAGPKAMAEYATAGATHRLARQVFDLRKAAGLTQRQLAAKSSVPYARDDRGARVRAWRRARSRADPPPQGGAPSAGEEAVVRSEEAVRPRCGSANELNLSSHGAMPQTSTNSFGRADFHTAENQRARQTFPSGGPRCSSSDEVPGGGIEPPTRGFSVPCSTD
jgi:hypothetical protein